MEPEHHEDHKIQRQNSYGGVHAAGTAIVLFVCLLVLTRQCFILISVIRTISQWQEIGTIYAYFHIINLKLKGNKFRCKEIMARKTKENVKT